MQNCVGPNLLSLLINSRSLEKYPTEKTKLHTRNSTNLSIKDDVTSNKNRDRRRQEIFRSDSRRLKKQEEELRWSQVQKDGLKTIISQDNHQDLKKDQRFQGLNKQLQTYTSDQKLLGRRFNRRCKIFDANYLQKSKERGNVHLDNNTEMSSTRRLIQKIENILPIAQEQTHLMSSYQPPVLRNQRQGPIRFQPVIPEVKNTQRIMGVTGIHTTAASKINIRPHLYQSPKKITFTYLNCDPRQHKAVPFVREQLDPLPINSKIMTNENKVQNGSYPLKTSKIVTKLTYDHVNPAPAKIKKAKIPRKMTFEEYVNREDGGKGQNWGKHSKISRVYVGKQCNEIQKSRARQEICSKISINNNCRQSLIMNNKDKMGKFLSKEESFSNVEEDNGSQRYFDDTDEGFMAKNISYKNIQIEKQDKFSENQETINPQNLFIDFQSSQVEEKNEKQDNKAKMSNLQVERQHPITHANKTSDLSTQQKKPHLKPQRLISITLIFLAALLLTIQILS